MKRRLFLILVLIGLLSVAMAQDRHPSGEIRLLVRGDDIGFCHAANVGCIESYKFGILRSVELLVPTPWFLEAVQMLNENPGLDVGIHLALTSEWSHLKWRPLTLAKSLVDSNGNFFPMVWPNKNLPPKTSIHETNWKLNEIESELRAQIELALKHVPQISHLSNHMGFTSLDPKIKQLVEKLAREYGLAAESYNDSCKRFPGWEGANTLQQRIDYFVWNLERLEPGTYLFVDHPAKDTPEMRSIFHQGYENVAEDREWVTQVFTSAKVLEAIKKKNIQLISYKELK
ncbi:polysaccharide deacetylase family protein [candidate division KSB1 bacterium]|nr:polysaccharide deacetylase family protein [candidate division KSB1 bacterium]